MSRNFAARSIRWFALVAAVLILLPSDSLGARLFSGGTVTGDDYKDAVLGGGHAEGDIWGGEQGSDPTISPNGPVIGDSTPLINTLPFGGKPRPEPTPNAGQAGWLRQLGMMLEWIGATLRLTNL